MVIKNKGYRVLTIFILLAAESLHKELRRCLSLVMLLFPVRFPMYPVLQELSFRKMPDNRDTDLHVPPSREASTRY
jgi:hypothetical protein